MLTRLFPVWAIFLGAIAFISPKVFIELKPAIFPLLMIVMFGMGLTLSWQDFKRVWSTKHLVGIGVLIQYTIMPFAAFVLAKLFALSDALTIGMILVGATAGGTASNVMTYLAKGDVALSVSMTIVSTLFAIVLLPVLTWLYIGEMVTVAIQDMLISLLQLILLPVVLGVILNALFHNKLQPVVRFFPAFSAAAIIMIIAIVIALNKENFALLNLTLVAAIVLHNTIGLLTGYWISRHLGYDSVIARTIAIEVGMQNSGLSVALALKYFTAASALPGALFSIWHNLSGSVFAVYFSTKKK